MKIDFDLAKRDKTMGERGLDFARAKEVFTGPVLSRDDGRFDYGEKRIITFGYLDGHMVVMVWTPRGAARRIISMRYANGREIEKYSASLG
ncbi:MAG: BrnT family toxin [Deltaproteobacteria bacterium]|nr:BrnT family toxin [Deltaproteobacteria bacterium]